MTEEKDILLQKQDTLAAANEEPVKKPGLMRGARDFFENTLGTLKGKDMNQAVEEFTSEMTLVAEGLSEDVSVLRRDVDRLSADMTLLEEHSRDASKGCEKETSQLRTALEALQKRVEALEKPPKDDKKAQKAGLAAVLRQATWLVGIFSAAWVVVTVLKMIGG